MDNGSTAAIKLDIHKYPNRRFYDVTRSRHVKLDELCDLIRQGYEITVTDSKTAHDITLQVLTQILLELDPPKLGIFPASLLHRLIRTNEKIVLDFTEKYFNRVLEFLLESQKHVETYLRQAAEFQSTAPDWRYMMFNPFVMIPFWNSFMPRPEGQHVSQPVADDAASFQKRIDDLQNQIRALEAQLAERS